MVHLLFCTRCKEITSKKGELLFKNNNDCCDKCTRFICSDYEHVKILTKLLHMPLDSLLIYAPIKQIWRLRVLLKWSISALYVKNSFIGRTAVKKRNISKNQHFFEYIFPLSANHSLLILLTFLVVFSRITVNFYTASWKIKIFVRMTTLKTLC